MTLCFGFFQSYWGFTEKKPTSADFGSMPFARRTWRVASACFAAWSEASLALSGWAAMLNWMSAVSGAVSNLPSAPTKMVLGNGLSVLLCALERALKTRRAQKVTRVVFIASLLLLESCIPEAATEIESNAFVIHL